MQKFGMGFFGVLIFNAPIRSFPSLEIQSTLGDFLGQKMNTLLIVTQSIA